MVAPCNSFSNSSMTGMGNLSLMVAWFKALSSTQKCQLPSYFRTSRTGDEKGLWLGLINPVSSIFPTSFSISFFWKCGYLYEQTETGFAPSTEGILWSCALGCVSPLGSSKISPYFYSSFSIWRSKIGRGMDCMLHSCNMAPCPSPIFLNLEGLIADKLLVVSPFNW